MALISKKSQMNGKEMCRDIIPPQRVLGEVVAVYLLSYVQLVCDPWTVTSQAPLSMEISRQEYQSGLPFPPPGNLPNPGIEAKSAEMAGRFFDTESREKLQEKRYSLYRYVHTPKCEHTPKVALTKDQITLEELRGLTVHYMRSRCELQLGVGQVEKNKKLGPAECLDTSVCNMTKQEKTWSVQEMVRKQFCQLESRPAQ